MDPTSNKSTLEEVTTIKMAAGNGSNTVDDWQLVILRYNLRPLDTGGYMACAIYLFSVGIIATGGNITTLIMFFKNKKLRIKPHNMLLINLAISDLGISVFGYPLTTASCFARRWLFGDAGCMLQGFTTFVFALADMYTLTVVSLYRWVAVCKPQYNHRLTFRATMKVIGAVWALSGIVCGLPLVGVSGYTLEAFGTSCTIDWDDNLPLSIFYVYMLIVIAYMLPVAIMCYCYTKVVMRSGQLMRVLKVTKGKTINLGDAEMANATIAENKVTWISFVMVLVFVVVWSPYALVSVWAIYDTANIPVWVNTLPTMFCKASCMLNPVVFYITNPVFRNTFRTTFMGNSKVAPFRNYSGLQTFRIDKTKDGVFIGECNVTFRKAETTMF